MSDASTPLDLTGVERVLVVTAHPDDVDFGFAGSVAQLTDAGIEVTYCIVTDGDAGGSETGLPAAEMARVGAARSRRAAAAVVGVHDAALPRLSRTAGSSRRSICAATSAA